MEKQPLVFDKEVQIVLKALDMFFNRTNKSSRIFPKPAVISLHLHDNGWCQNERPCGGKKIRATNENRNFTEVFGLYDYRILISEKWIQRRLTNVLKNGNRIQKWHSHQRNSDERRVWLVHASCIGFSPRLCSQAWKWSLRFTSKTSFLRWSMQTKMVRQIKEWCFFWSVSLQPTKRSTFPHAVLLRHESVACHCFMSFGLCDKNGTASCDYKSQPSSKKDSPHTSD